MKTNKSLFLVICCAIMVVLVFTSGGTEPVECFSWSMESSKKYKVFLCEYVPTKKYVEIDGEKVNLPLKEAWGEWVYRYCGKNDIRPFDNKQIVLNFKRFLRLPKPHKGNITINGNYLTWEHRRIYKRYNKEYQLPDSIQFHIIEMTKYEEFKYQSDTLGSFWLVKKPQ